MSNIHLKNVKHLDNLLSFIETNDIKSAETLITIYPEVMKQKCSDGEEVIYFIVRNKNNKMFRIFLKHQPLISSYNLPKLFDEIISGGTTKMMRTFVNHFKLDFQNSVYKVFIEKILAQTEIFHEFLLMETNIAFCFSVPADSFEYMGYNCPCKDLKDRKKLIYINKKKDSDEAFNLDTYANPYVKKENIIFYRYEKFFLVMKKSTIPIKNVKDSTLKEIVKYI